MMEAVKNMFSSKKGDSTEPMEGTEPSEVTEATEAMDMDPPRTSSKGTKDEPLALKLIGAKIGENTICQMTIVKEGDKKKESKTKKENRIPVLVLDCSGSMGHWVQRSVNSWQKALQSQNFADDTKVFMIEFESSTIMTEHKLKDLDKLGMNSRGGTSMDGVAQKLGSIFAKFPQHAINIWVVSDGQISSQEQFKGSMTKHLAAHLNSPNISVVGIRLASGYNDPDVQAMSAVGLLSSKEFQLEDCNMGDYHNVKNDVPEMVSLMSGMKSQDQAVTVTSKKAMLALRPGDDAETSLSLWTGDFFMVKGLWEDAAVTFNELTFQLQYYPEENNLEFLEKFATKVFFRLAQEKVAGLYDNTKYIEALEQLFFDLDNMSTAMEQELETKLDLFSTTSRSLELQKKFGTQKRTIRQKIQELKNMGDLERLSGQMQSNLMRNLGTGRGDKNLLRRFARTAQGKNPSEMIHDAINFVEGALIEIKVEKEQDNPEKCFFSQETSLEAAINSIDNGVTLYKDSNGEMTADDVLQIFGLNGMAIRHKVNNYTDPMKIGLNHGLFDTIYDVYTNVCLNQSVLWYAKQNGQALKAPGFDKEITAVVPIKSWNHPAVWKLYTRDTEISSIQLSAHMRNVLTPFPKDRQAFTTSLLFKMMSEYESPSEIQTKIMSDLLMSIQWKNQNEDAKTLADALKGDNPLSQLSSANNLASQMAPFCLFLCDTSLLEYLSTPESKNLWKALVANTVYWTVRQGVGEADRHDTLMKLLDYSDDKITHVLPDDQEEPEKPVFNDQIDGKKATSYLKKHKYLFGIKLYINMLSLARSFVAHGKKTVPEMFKFVPAKKEDIEELIGMNFNLFCLVEAVKSIQTKTETERYGKDAIGLHESEEDARKFMRNILRLKYIDAYEKEKKAKVERIKENKRQAFIAEMSGLSWEAFTNGLDENVPSQGSKGVAEIVEKLQVNKESIVDMDKKVMLLLVGRAEGVVWGTGSSNRVYAPVLLALLEPLKSAEDFSAIRDYIAKNSWHRYRDSEPNRQGHSNEVPSFWAASNFVDPWSFLKKSKYNYRAFLDNLKSWENGDEAQVAFYNQWKHLLTTDPSKNDVTGGAQGLMTGKQKRKLRKVHTNEIHAQRKKMKMEN